MKMLFSYREKFPKIISPIRSQGTTNCCAHFSGGAAVEMRSRLKWLKEGRFGANDVLPEIDINKLIERCPRPIDGALPAIEVMRFLEECVSVPSATTSKTKGEFVTKEVIKLCPRNGAQELYKLIVHLILGGPVVGCFSVKKDFRPHLMEVYMGEEEHVLKTRRQGHCVAIVGFGIDDNYNLLFEYLESCLPWAATFKKDGFGFINVWAIDKAYVPIV